HDALELVKTALAVKPVPVVDLVEREEEVADGPDDGAAGGRDTAVIRIVEGAHDGPRQCETRRVEGHLSVPDPLRHQPRAGLALLQDSAPERGPGGGRVDPAHRIGRLRSIEPGDVLV